MNAGLEQFFAECRADPEISANAEGLDKLEELFTAVYRAGDTDPPDDRVRQIIAQKRPLKERVAALTALPSKILGI